MTVEHSVGGEPLVTITDEARELVLDYRARSEKPDREDLAMWVEVAGVADAEFKYAVYLRHADDRGPNDAFVQANDGLAIVIPESSIEQLRGATIDVSEEPEGDALHVRNPNSPSPAVKARRSAPTLELSGDVTQQVRQILDQYISPALASHGGGCELVGVEDGTVSVRLSGGCQGCSMASATLTQGIEAVMKEAIPEVTRVVDVTDHGVGADPYYEAAGE